VITLFYDKAGNVLFFVDDHDSTAYWYLIRAWPYRTERVPGFSSGFILDYTDHVEAGRSA
jgi:hypothetical protein